MEKSGFHTTKSSFINAPILDELPVALECKFLKYSEDGNIIGQIVNVSVDESALGADGKIDFTKFRPISFEPVHRAYHVLGKGGQRIPRWWSVEIILKIVLAKQAKTVVMEITRMAYHPIFADILIQVTEFVYAL